MRNTNSAFHINFHLFDHLAFQILKLTFPTFDINSFKDRNVQILRMLITP